MVEEISHTGDTDLVYLSSFRTTFTQVSLTQVQSTPELPVVSCTDTSKLL